MAPQLEYPAKFTRCVQQVEESGAWMLPGDDGEWLCVQPAAAGEEGDSE